MRHTLRLVAVCCWSALAVTFGVAAVVSCWGWVFPAFFAAFAGAAETDRVV